jgi:hypothetical protein
VVLASVVDGAVAAVRGRTSLLWAQEECRHLLARQFAVALGIGLRYSGFFSPGPFLGHMHGRENKAAVAGKRGGSEGARRNEDLAALCDISVH